MRKTPIIPLDEVLNRTDVHKKYVIEKYFRQNRKEPWIAIVWLVIFGVFGAHRIYLRQYREALIVFFCVLITAIIPPLVIFVLVVDLFLMPKSLNEYNRILRLQLEKEVFSYD